MDFNEVISFFTKNNFHLKYLGLFLEDYSELTIWYKIYWFLLHVVLMGVFNSVLLIEWMRSITSLISFASTGYIILSCIMGQVKLLSLLKHREDIKEIIKQFGEKDFWPRTAEEWNIVNKEIEFLKMANKLMIISTYLSLSSLICSPFFGYKLNGLPVPAWYPMNVTVSPIYEIVIIHQDISLLFVGSGYIFVEVMFCGTLTYIGLQCNLLSFRIQKIVDTNSSSLEMKETLVECVTHHRKIIKFLQTTEKICGNIYFWQLFTCTMSLCMDLFLLSLTPPTSFEFFYLCVYYINISSLLLVPCWFASEMTRKSENIPIAIYNCNWMDTCDGFKKELIFLMQRSQRPFKLYAANLFEISVEIYVRIIRASLSYFAVLNNLQKS